MCQCIEISNFCKSKTATDELDKQVNKVEKNVCNPQKVKSLLIGGVLARLAQSVELKHSKSQGRDFEPHVEVEITGKI